MQLFIEFSYNVFYFCKISSNVSSFTPPWYIYCAGGVKGEDGLNFTPDARGLAVEKSNYDSESKGFAFLDMESGNMYFKLSDTSGDWSNAVPFRGEKGEKGEQGAQGPQGPQGLDGTVRLVVSSTEPADPVVGMIWIQEW